MELVEIGRGKGNWTFSLLLSYRVDLAPHFKLALVLFGLAEVTGGHCETRRTGLNILEQSPLIISTLANMEINICIKVRDHPFIVLQHVPVKAPERLLQ